MNTIMNYTDPDHMGLDHLKSALQEPLLLKRNYLNLPLIYGVDK